MIKQIAAGISIAFTIFWCSIIFIEYWHYNPNYEKAISYFSYPYLLGILLLIGGLLSGLITKAKFPLKLFNGLTVFAGLILLDILGMVFLYGKIESLNLSAKGFFTHLFHLIGVAGSVYFVYLVTRVIGRMLIQTLPVPIEKEDLPVIQAALGIMILTLILFFLGLLGLLKAVILGPLFLIFLVVDWRSSVYIVKTTLIKPFVNSKKLNALGVFCFLFIGFFLLSDFVQILRPFPAGTDSINLYVNLPNLIGNSGQLVAGNQPYNWSLFMSIGTVLFGRIDVTLALSFLGGFLALQALYALSRKWLSVNQSALVVLLFVTMPMVNFFLYQDMKIDLGLLFMTLSILLIFYNWVSPPLITKTEAKENPVSKKTRKKGTKKHTVLQTKQVTPAWQLSLRSFFSKKLPNKIKENRFMVLMGLLMGFAFGVKLTILFFLFALGTAIWHSKGGFLGFLAALFLSLGAVFILQLDAHPLLRSFHENISVLQWVLFALGLGLTGYWFSKSKASVLGAFQSTAILALFFILPVLPWLGKNYAETGKVTTQTLLNGKKATPEIGISGLKTKKEFIIPGPYKMPEPAKQNNDQKKSKKKVKKDAVRVDLHRFMGFEVLPARYLSLPYDTFQRTNVDLNMNGVSFLLLMLLPILFLIQGKSNKWAIPFNLLTIVLCMLMLIISIPSAYMNKQSISSIEEANTHLKEHPNEGFLGDWSNAVNEVSFQLYEPIHTWFSSVSGKSDSVSYPLLIALFLLLTFMVHYRSRNHDSKTKSILFFLTTYFYLWWLLGAGGSWYGMMLFCLPFVFLIKGLYPKTGADNESISLVKTLKKGGFLAICSIWVFMAFTFRTTNYNVKDKESAKQLYVPPFVEYQVGNLTENRLTNLTFSGAGEVKRVVNKTNGLVYRVGTQMNFFIDNNDRRVYSDTFLDTYEKIIRKFKDKKKIMVALKERGFEYIVFDVNLAANDRTPEKSLSRKFTNFMNTLYDNSTIELVMTDRLIKMNDTGKTIPGLFPENGTIANYGKWAVFKIK